MIIAIEHNDVGPRVIRRDALEIRLRRSRNQRRQEENTLECEIC